MAEREELSGREPELDTSLTYRRCIKQPEHIIIEEAERIGIDDPDEKGKDQLCEEIIDLYDENRIVTNCTDNFRFLVDEMASHYGINASGKSIETICDRLESEIMRASNLKCESDRLARVQIRARLNGIDIRGKTKAELCEALDKPIVIPSEINEYDTPGTQPISPAYTDAVYLFLNEQFKDVGCTYATSMENQNYIYFESDTLELFVEPDITQIDDCIRGSARFVNFPITIYNSTNLSKSHANTILYDKKDRSLEQFEPQTYGNNSIFPNSTVAIFRFAQWLNETYGPGFVEQMYPVNDFCPRAGWQVIERAEKTIISEYDPGGFCAFWTAFYVYLRFGNPDLTRNQVIQKATVELKKDSFKTFIRKFGRFAASLHELRENEDDEYSDDIRMGRNYDDDDYY